MTVNALISAKAAGSAALGIAAQGRDQVDQNLVDNLVKKDTNDRRAEDLAAAKSKQASTSSPAGNYAGVGSPLAVFRLSVAVKLDTGNYTGSKNDYVDFEMAPARRSYVERQAQTVPGADAGLTHKLGANLAKLKVPGGRPIPQTMGMGDEVIEFVGAFIGMDEYTAIRDEDLVWDNPAFSKGSELNRASAYQRSRKVAWAIRHGKEMMLQLEWGNGYKIEFEPGEQFLGIVENVTFSHATEQRVYYKILFYVTNREVINSGNDVGKTFALPDKLLSALPLGGGAGKTTAQEQAEAKIAARGYDVDGDYALSAMAESIVPGTSSETQQKIQLIRARVMATKFNPKDLYEADQKTLKSTTVTPAVAQQLVTDTKLIADSMKPGTKGKDIAGHLYERAREYNDFITSPESKLQPTAAAKENKPPKLVSPKKPELQGPQPRRLTRSANTVAK